MEIRRIITSLGIAAATVVGVAGCKGNSQKLVQPLEKQAKVLVKDTARNYADFEIYCRSNLHLKVENGISFVADKIKYTSKNGEIIGEFLDMNESQINAASKFTTNRHSLSLPAYDAIKMVAGFSGEKAYDDTLTLSRSDIMEARAKLKNGNIWKNAKEYFDNVGDNFFRLGKVKSNSNPDGINMEIYDRSSKIADVLFSANE